MHFYLCRWDGNGTADDPFRPAGTDQLPVGWQAIDLRADPTTSAGWCFVATSQPPPANLPAGVQHLGDDPAEVKESLVDLIQTRWPGLFNDIRAQIPADERNLRGLLKYLLVRHPDRLGLNPVRPGRDGRLRIRLGGLLVDEQV